MQSSTPNNSQPPPPPPPQDPDEARRARRRVAAEQRKRIANACLACKSRKQKCDGQQPCNICSRRSASCVYVEQPPRHLKRRRATPQTGDDPSDRTSLRSTRSPCSPGQNPQTLSTTTGASPQRQRCDSIASILQADTRYVYPTPSTDEDDRVEAPVDYRTRMLSDPKGRLLYIGETGSLSFLARVRKMVENSLGPSNFTSDSAQNSIADKPAVPRQHPAPGTFPSLPDMPNATALIDYFFANVNCIHYVLDRAEMTQIISSVYSPGNVMSVTGDRDRDIALVNAVCAVGTFFTVQNEVSAQQGMRYFDTARTVIEDVFESADFWSIRLLLLFALYMHYAAKRNASWTYIGLAIRIAESLGLHRISTVEQFRGDHERRRRLVFWSLYNLDRFTGCSLGRPLAIQDENCNDPVFSTAPSNDILVDRHCDGDPVDPNHHIHQMVARVRLHVIIGHIIKLVYLRRTISRDVAEALSDELKAWWKALPPCASLDNLNCGGKDWSIVQLHMSYLHAVTLLTRPFLQRVVEASIEEITGKTADGNCPCKRKSSGKSNVKRKMLRYAGACVLVAERTVALAHRMRRRGNLQRNDATLM
ncbi:fungal-specific transcription factor domain-containing protein [Sphaerosporella brunnea]|uniref:Fungal-specific transcription factor domain-containing protein n=1 Tax=Sphaerosporella brunnea TaxID=1250544 RepID=A0A5J5EP61_9PEZI|nr:fungal-specific transcription factor domain-containing protein [Sphaerosporella brunnea]